MVARTARLTWLVFRFSSLPIIARTSLRWLRANRNTASRRRSSSSVNDCSAPLLFALPRRPRTTHHSSIGLRVLGWAIWVGCFALSPVHTKRVPLDQFVVCPSCSIEGPTHRLDRHADRRRGRSACVEGKDTFTRLAGQYRRTPDSLAEAGDNLTYKLLLGNDKRGEDGRQSRCILRGILGGCEGPVGR